MGAKSGGLYTHQVTHSVQALPLSSVGVVNKWITTTKVENSNPRVFYNYEWPRGESQLMHKLWAGSGTHERCPMNSWTCDIHNQWEQKATNEWVAPTSMTKEGDWKQEPRYNATSWVWSLGLCFWPESHHRCCLLELHQKMHRVTCVSVTGREAVLTLLRENHIPVSQALK